MSRGNAEFLGVHRAVGFLAELDDAKRVHLATPLQSAVVKIGDDVLHGVGLDARAGAVAGERLLNGAVGVDEIGIVLIHDVHHP